MLLHYASEHQNFKITELLILNNQTLMHVTMKMIHNYIVQADAKKTIIATLLHNGADVSIKNIHKSEYFDLISTSEFNLLINKDDKIDIEKINVLEK